MKTKRATILLTAVMLMFNMNTKTVRAASYLEQDATFIMIEEHEEINALENDSSTNTISPFSLSTSSMRLSKKNNTLYVSWTIKSTNIASEIGISSLRLQKYTSGRWQSVKTGSYSAKNKRIFSSSYSYSSASPGTKYRAVGTAYTIVNGKRTSKTVQTNTITF